MFEPEGAALPYHPAVTHHEPKNVATSDVWVISSSTRTQRVLDWVLSHSAWLNKNTTHASEISGCYGPD